MENQSGTRIIGCLCQFVLGTHDEEGHLIKEDVDPEGFKLLWPFGPSLATRVDERHRKLLAAEQEAAPADTAPGWMVRDGREATAPR